MPSPLTSSRWWWWPDFWFAWMGAATEKFNSVMTLDPFTQPDSSLWRYSVFSFSIVFTLFIHPKRYSLGISNRLYFELLNFEKFYWFIPSVILCLTFFCVVPSWNSFMLDFWLPGLNLQFVFLFYFHLYHPLLPVLQFWGDFFDFLYWVFY